MRLDQWLVETGAVRSRERAKQAIKEGRVRIDGEVVTKASATLPDGAEVAFEGEAHDYVSRGALKLLRGLDDFKIDPAGLACLDLGASTGGFTEVLLRRGAKKVYAVDVGHGQLDPTVRADPRVVNLEKTHAKELTTVLVPELVDLLVCDVSFISIMKALPPAFALCRSNAKAVILVKPQFELGPEHIGKGGLVTMPPDDQRIWVEGTILPFFKDHGWRVRSLIDSPIKGGDGNREFLLGAEHGA